MEVIGPVLWDYAWGSPSAIQGLLGVEGPCIAEAWFGAHPLAPSVAVTGERLDTIINGDPERVLGTQVLNRFGAVLPYLLKVIAAEKPLSLQVHPSLERAQAGFAEEERDGVPRDAPHRNFRDPNHKPELLLALTEFEVLCGFRTPKRAARILAGLGTELTDSLSDALDRDPTENGLRSVFTKLVSDGVTADDVAKVVAACSQRLERGSSFPEADRTVTKLADQYPGDPGVVTSLLLNRIVLEPGHALFVPAGGVHSYLGGVGIEVMANSDNVLRAGLTAKHINVAEMLRNVDYVAGPPVLVRGESAGPSTTVFPVPVDDFELSVTDVSSDTGERLVPGHGPRVVLCLVGAVELLLREDRLTLSQGNAVFLAAGDGEVRVCGTGRIVQVCA